MSLSQVLNSRRYNPNAEVERGSAAKFGFKTSRAGPGRDRLREDGIQLRRSRRGPLQHSGQERSVFGEAAPSSGKFEGGLLADLPEDRPGDEDLVLLRYVTLKKHPNLFVTY